MNNLFLTLLHTYTQLIAFQIRFPRHTLLTEDRLLILLSFVQKLQPYYMMTYSLAPTDATKKWNDIWHPGDESLKWYINEWFRSNNSQPLLYFKRFAAQVLKRLWVGVGYLRKLSTLMSLTPTQNSLSS